MTKFKEIAEINPTETLKKNTLARYVAMENLQPFTRQITRYYVKKYSGGMKFRNGDTLMARITPCLENGKTAYVDILDEDEVGFGSTEYIVIRGKENISDGMYLYYLATSSRFREIAIKAMSGTSGRQRVQIDVLKDADINLPPFPEQHRIANILSSFDNKIELLRKENNTLEDIAQNIFKEWFVKYNFPNKDGKPYKDNKGKMIDSELGEIPEGWRVKILGTIAHIERGFGGKYVKKSNVKNLNQKVNRGKILEKSNFKYYNENLKIPDSKFAKKNDILLNSLGEGTIGRIHFYKDIDPNVVIDQHITIIRSNDFYLFEYIYLYLIDRINIARLLAEITGTTGMLMLNISKVRDFSILVPENQVLCKFNDTVSQLFEKAGLNNIQIETLENVKAYLLRRLIKI